MNHRNRKSAAGKIRLTPKSTGGTILESDGAATPTTVFKLGFRGMYIPSIPMVRIFLEYYPRCNSPVVDAERSGLGPIEPKRQEHDASPPSPRYTTIRRDKQYLINRASTVVAASCILPGDVSRSNFGGVLFCG